MDRAFSVADYAELARKEINDILSRGKVPVLCGGTGLYIKAIVDNVQYSEAITGDEALRERLRPGGAILIGDVAFESRAALEACRAAAGESWDGEEVYFVADELREALPGSRFEKLSPCAGILTLERA